MVQNNVTGIIVEREDVLSTAEAICKLIEDPVLRLEMGHAGRLHVQAEYEWSYCVELMEDVYTKVLRNWN